MSLLALIKAHPLTSAVVGAGAVAVPATAGAYASGAFSGKSTKQFTAPSSISLDTTTRNSVLDRSPSACSGGFFPGVKLGTKTERGHNGNVPDDNVEVGKLMGCVQMKLDYKDDNNLSFYAEIAAKTDTWGWEIQIYINTGNGQNAGKNNQGASSSQTFTYTVFWLNRDPSTKKWTVEKGMYFGPNQSNPEKIDLSFGDRVLLANGTKDSSISENPKFWFATWEESADGKRIFEEVKLKYNNAKSVLYVGEPVSSNSSGGGDECVIDTTMDPGSNSYDNHKWAEGPSSNTPHEVCKKYKEQLKGKKGKWTWHDDPKAFCRNLEQELESSSNDEAKSRKLMNYCYSYS